MIWSRLRPVIVSLVLLFSFFSFTTPFASAAAVLPASEVQALKEIGQTLGKADWNFSVDPCSGQNSWGIAGSENTVTCNCSYSNNTVCHVISIILKSQNLQGTLPPQLVNLPYLIEIDLTRNYLNGTIPPEWGSLNLLNISLLANRVSGPIPKEIGNISTLKSLVLEFNQLSGVLPPELGNLPQIQRLFLTSNYFIGEIPATFANLTSLKDLRIGDNQFTGKIPSFIQNWKGLEKLIIQGSGLEGPIPPEIANLNNLLDLRISDLKGPPSPFPPLFINLSMRTLILKSCNLIGSIPDYILKLAGLKILDLSFNNLTGPIPGNFENYQLDEYDDCLLQGQRVLQDFNIAAEAHGNGKAVIKTFTANVTDGTLEIRFFWAGKGTVSIPKKGDYGPLISAISVTPNFDTPKEPGTGSSISAGAVGGIAVAGIAAIVLFVGIIWWIRNQRQKHSMQKELKGLDLQTGTFTLRQLKAATDDFDVANKIGEGGFGSVYKAQALKERGDPMELVDPRLGMDFDKEEMMVTINIALLCAEASPAARPAMSSVVSMLEGNLVLLSPAGPSSVNDEITYKAMRNHFQYVKVKKVTETETQSTQIDTTLTASSTSAGDLYPIELDSSYYHGRD
ncbi:hypothetical protein SAY86_029297 [Trapa natans]|uniref:non-specific serine/threonine protein kinase n=1 Tax=Trapa natans TaxID=22666 RepID=A0AAN7ML44_TRANT|nr:hypothetical protein SAY86_029297 [Trapa natans]